MRDLFEHDDGGWLQDPALLDRLVTEKLKAEAETCAPRAGSGSRSLPTSLRPHRGPAPAPRPDAAISPTRSGRAARPCSAELDRLEQEYAEADELPEEVDQRLGEIETALEAFEERPVVYDPAEIARAGVFVSIDRDGDLRIERGYVRPEDEPPVEPVEGGRWRCPEPPASRTVRSSVPSSPSAPAPAEPKPKRRGRRSQAAVGTARHRAHGAPHAGAARRGCQRSRCRLRGGAARALPRRLLSDVVGHLPGDLGQERELQPQAPGSPTAPPPRRSRPAISNGQSSCPRTKATLGRARRVRRRQPAALFAHCASLASTPCMSRGTAIRGASLTPTLARAVNLDMAAAGWRRPSTTISAASRRRASSRRCGRRRAKRPRSSSTT